MRRLSVRKKCMECGKEMWVAPSSIRAGRGKYCSKSCASKNVVYLMHKARGQSWRDNIRKANIKRFKDCTKHPRWMGDKVGYWGLHDWLTKNYGQPKKCEVCGLNDENRKYHWANLSHQYKRDRDDFKRMCVSCHRKYDYNKKKEQYA